jgi:hypothetical protein
MSGLNQTSRRFLASLLLCVLAYVSATSNVCPTCGRVGQVSTSHPVAHNADQNGPPDCDRDGCSCCGFQFDSAYFHPTLALSESPDVRNCFQLRVPIAPVLTLYRPPRN